VNALDTSKSLGVRTLLRQVAPPPQIFMIGDSMSDFIDMLGVRHLAVANAAPAFAALAERVASTPYTDGCIELLSAL
jgi:hydroxymethylpyrimidine pyrophosphatase-like HAD family hydrolase